MIISIVLGFNSRARVGRDCLCKRHFKNSCVSTHAPVWGATFSELVEDDKYIGFNSRARVGRDVQRQGRRQDRRGFNSRARVGRDRL